jgi:hypothetical protein
MHTGDSEAFPPLPLAQAAKECGKISGADTNKNIALPRIGTETLRRFEEEDPPELSAVLGTRPGSSGWYWDKQASLLAWCRVDANHQEPEFADASW